MNFISPSYSKLLPQKPDEKINLMKFKGTHFFLILLLPFIISAKEIPIYRFEKGECLVYTMRYRSVSNYDLGILFKEVVEEKKIPYMGTSKGSLRTVLSGQLSLYPVASETNTTTLLCKFKVLHFALYLNDQLTGLAKEDLKRDLEMPFVIHINNRGEISSIQVDKRMSEMGSSYLRTLLAQIQFILPENGKINEWSREESDPGGLYVASYKKVKIIGKGLVSFQKEKSRYLSKQMDNSQSILCPIILPKSKVKIDFDINNGRIVSIEGGENQEIFIGKGKVGEVKNEISFRLFRKEKLGEREIPQILDFYLSMKSELKSISLYVEPSVKEIQTNIYQKILGNTGLESLLEELGRMVQGQGEDDIKTYLKLKALIFLHPEVCKELGRIIIEKGTIDFSSKIIMEALSSVANPEAQDALVDFIKSKEGDRGAIMEALYAVSDIQTPTQATIDLLWELAFHSKEQDVLYSAQLILGIMAHRLRTTSPYVSEKIVNEFLKRLDTADSAKEIIQLLLAIGNAGSGLSLNALMKYSRNQSEDIRKASYRAMRFIEGELAEEVLLNGMTSDISPSVRLECAISLSYRKMSQRSFTEHKNLLLKSKDIALRMQLIKNLWEAKDYHPEILPLLKKIAKEDPQKEVRETASNLISHDIRGK